VHLAAGDPRLTVQPEELLVGRSCHDGAEVVTARDEGVAYALVSPVAASPTKPGYGPALGAAGLRELVENADRLPLLALGGVTPDNAATWRAAGARGIAVMGGVMAATDPAATVRRLLLAWRGA
jgi:thiamine-phosphate pyrophosphorylase